MEWLSRRFYRELISITAENNEIGFRMCGYITNANYSTKKLQFLLFINNRLVCSLSLRRALEVVYASLLPKNSHPFVYMSVFIDPGNIDVNVHPTKHEVCFLHENLIVDSIQRAIEESLLNCNSSRTYYTQTLLPSAPAQVIGIGSSEKCVSERVYDYKLVRTDTKEKKLDAFAMPRSKSCVNVSKNINRKRKQVNLSSILSLQASIVKSRHDGLYNLFRNCTYVGCIDQTRILLQYKTGLYLVDSSRVSKELFFQIVIFDFSNCGALQLKPPAPIFETVMLAIEAPSSGRVFSS